MAEKLTSLDERLYTYLLAHEPPEHDELRSLRLHTRPDHTVGVRLVSLTPSKSFPLYPNKRARLASTRTSG
jgi:hypothetical protein